MNKDLVSDLIDALTILPGVGKKSAQRMALYLLDKNKDGGNILANTLLQSIENTAFPTKIILGYQNNYVIQ